MTADVSIRRLPPPRLALTMAEAADSIGVSADFFREHVLPDLRVVRVGRKKLVSISELERWLQRSSALTLRDDR